MKKQTRVTHFLSPRRHERLVRMQEVGRKPLLRFLHSPHPCGLATQGRKMLLPFLHSLHPCNLAVAESTKKKHKLRALRVFVVNKKIGYAGYILYRTLPKA